MLWERKLSIYTFGISNWKLEIVVKLNIRNLLTLSNILDVIQPSNTIEETNNKETFQFGLRF